MTPRTGGEARAAPVARPEVHVAPACTGSDTHPTPAAIRAGGVTLWFVDTGDEAVSALLPCGVLPKCPRGRTPH